MNPIKDAADAKRRLASKLLNVSGHQVVSSENGVFNNPDIIGLTKSDMLVEYEIKVSKQDLMGELNSIRKCKAMILANNYNKQNNTTLSDGSKVSLRGNIFVSEQEEDELSKIKGKCAKLDKHMTYLIAEPSKRNAFGEYEQPYRPNQFYFAVTSDLVEFAVDACFGIPYGIINLNMLNSSSSIVKRAGFIHRNEASRYDIAVMARALSFAYWS